MYAQVRRQASKNFLALLVVAGLVLIPGVASGIEKLKFKPGYNLFSSQQDAQLGREAAGQADKQLPLVNDAQVVGYVNELGRRLASFAPNNNPNYSWTFKVVNSTDINAFALPGGFIYVNRGAIEAAEDEAQIAGVIAHESGHVVMRHGTHQATQAVIAQVPLAILGGVLGQSSSLTAQLAQMGIGFGVNSLMLKNSRGAEAQADEVGTYILYHAGYDPHAMAQFFEIIEKKYPQRTVQFFSDHPNPENRVKAVDEEIPLLGPAREWKTDSPAFVSVKKRLLAMPPPPKAKPASASSSRSANPPPLPSRRLLRYEGRGFVLSYPENWQVEKTEDAIALFPPGGIVANSDSGPAQAYGASLSMFRPKDLGSRGWGLIDATQQLLDSLRQSNPNLRVVKQTGMKLHGRSVLSTLLENDSPLEGQKERDQLLTLRDRDSLLTLIFIAPEASFEVYQPTFEAMLRSLELL